MRRRRLRYRVRPTGRRPALTGSGVVAPSSRPGRIIAHARRHAMLISGDDEVPGRRHRRRAVVAQTSRPTVPRVDLVRTREHFVETM